MDKVKIAWKVEALFLRNGRVVIMHLPTGKVCFSRYRHDQHRYREHKDGAGIYWSGEATRHFHGEEYA